MLIAFDTAWPGCNPFLGFPRDAREIYNNPQRFFRLLQGASAGRVPAHAVFVALVPGGTLTAEPDKNTSIAKMILTFTVGGGRNPVSLHLFVKFQTSRGTPSWVKALFSAYSSCHNEREFYASGLYAQVPMATPTPIASWFSRPFHRVLTVLELIPEGTTMIVPDHQGATIPQMTDLLCHAARMHARFWRQHEGPRSSVLAATAGAASAWDRSKDPTGHIVARHGLEWVSSIDLFAASHKEVWFAPVWTALKAHYAAYPKMTLSHGDCRPGNMLFHPRSKTESGHDIIFSDWEAVSYTPHMWDVAYATCIGLHVDTRRKNQTVLVDAYLAELQKHGVPASELTRDDVEVDLALMTLLLFFYSWLLMQTGGVCLVLFSNCVYCPCLICHDFNACYHYSDISFYL